MQLLLPSSHTRCSVFLRCLNPKTLRGNFHINPIPSHQETYALKSQELYHPLFGQMQLTSDGGPASADNALSPDILLEPHFVKTMSSSGAKHHAPPIRLLRCPVPIPPLLALVHIHFPILPRQQQRQHGSRGTCSNNHRVACLLPLHTTRRRCNHRPTRTPPAIPLPVPP